MEGEIDSATDILFPLPSFFPLERLEFIAVLSCTPFVACRHRVFGYPSTMICQQNGKPYVGAAQCVKPYLTT